MDANLAVREVAVNLGVTLPQIYNLLRADRLLGAFKTDGEWQVPQATVNEYLKKRQQRLANRPRNEQPRVAA